MGRFRDASDDDGGETGIDMSPLIDCVFILLIFFIVTTVFVEEVGVEGRQASSSVGIRSREEQHHHRSDGPAVTSSTADRRSASPVFSLLSVACCRAGDDEMPVIVQPDQASPSGILVKVIDAAKLGGAKKVSLATQK